MMKRIIRTITGEIFRIVVIVSLFLFLLISSYFIYATITTNITINQDSHENKTSTHFYVKKGGSGVHVDIVIPYVLYEEIIDTVEVIEECGVRWYSLDTTTIEIDTIYVSYGWGSEVFYTNVPTWDDLSFKIATQALITQQDAVMHVTEHFNIEDDWIYVPIYPDNLNTMKRLINESFTYDENDKRIQISNNLYKANGKYNLFNTCNSWTNNILKQSNIESCYWTPFSYQIINNLK